MNAARTLTWSSAPFEGWTVVLLVDGWSAGLWNPEVGARADRLEEALEGAHVTVASMGGEGSRLDDALRAAEFLGSREVVVVAPPESGAFGWTTPSCRLPVHLLRTRHDDEIPRRLGELLAFRAA